MCLSWITGWRLRRRLQQPAPERFRAFDEADRLVMLALGRDIPSLRPVLAELAAAGKKITLVVEARGKGELPAAIPGCDPVLPLRSSWLWRRPTRQFLGNFDRHDGEVLIDVSTARSLPLLCLAVHSRATFKIGVPKEEANPFHLQILVPAHRPGKEADGDAPASGKRGLDAGELLRNALFYWKKIGVKENNL